MRLAIRSLVATADLAAPDSVARRPVPACCPRCPRISGTASSSRLAAQFASAGMPNARCHVPEPSLFGGTHPALRVRRRATRRCRPATARCLAFAPPGSPARIISGHTRRPQRDESGSRTRNSDALRKVLMRRDGTAFEAALLRAADELHVDSFVSEATWRALAARYNTNQLVDTVDGVGAFTMHAGAINSLGVEIEADVPDRLPSGIDYAVAARRTNVRLTGKEPRIPPLDPKDGRRNFANDLTRTGPAASGERVHHVCAQSRR